MEVPHQGARRQAVQFRLGQFCFGIACAWGLDSNDAIDAEELQGSRLKEWRFWALIVAEIRVWAIGGI